LVGGGHGENDDWKDLASFVLPKRIDETSAQAARIWDNPEGFDGK